MVDELDVPALHQWLSACRLLMLYHPRAGAELAALHFGESDRFRLGWNITKHSDYSTHREAFIYVSADEGETRLTPPPGIRREDMHEVGPEPDLQTTRLWRITEKLADELLHLDSELFPKRRVSAVMEDIVKASKSDGITHDMEAAGVAMERAMLHSQTGDLSFEGPTRDFVNPARAIVNAYLSFELPGMIASLVLADLISAQCHSSIGPATRVAAFDHLADTTIRLFQARGNKKVTPYAELTQLMSLYAFTTANLASQIRQMGGLTPEEHERVDNHARHVDEQLAHYVQATFLLTALYPSRGVLEWLDAAGSEPQLPDHDCIHPRLRALLNPPGDPRYLTMTADEVWTAYRENCESSEEFDVRRAIEGEFGPVGDLFLFLATS